MDYIISRELKGLKNVMATLDCIDIVISGENVEKSKEYFCSGIKEYDGDYETRLEDLLAAMEKCAFYNGLLTGVKLFKVLDRTELEDNTL